MKEPVPVAPGKHRIEAAYSGRIKSITIECKLGEIVKAKIDFESGNDDQHPPVVNEGERSTAGYAVPIGLGVLGVASVVTGAIFASSSQSSKDEADALRRPGVCADPTSPACIDYDDKRSSAETQATIAYVGYVAGGVLLAGSIASFVFWPKSGKSAAPTRGMAFTPHAGPQGGGATFKLTF
jgi:hypothetical protein